MQKILLILGTVALSTNLAFASIDLNLKYGQKGQEVSELQEFLVDKGILTGNATGFFGLLTLKAVKAYQVSQKLPSTGFVGPMTRSKINTEIEAEIANSNAAEVTETGTTTPVGTPSLAVDICPNIEGLQTAVPTGMFKDSVNGCFVPPVITNVASSVNAGTPAPAPEPFKKLLVKMTTDGRVYIHSSKDIDFSSIKFVRPVCVPLPRSGCTDWTNSQNVNVSIVMNTKEAPDSDSAKTRYYYAHLVGNFTDYLTAEERELSKTGDIGYLMKVTISSTDGVTKTFESGANFLKGGLSSGFTEFSTP